MSYQSILFETEGPTALVTLNRPQRRNALSLELMTELIACLNEIGRDRSLRAVILGAAGKVFSSDQAAFATPGVKIGLFCTTPMVALSRAVGRKRALQMLMTGDMVDAFTAVEWGLINIAVPASELEQQSRKLAARIAEASSLTVALGKQAFYTQIDL